MPATLLMSFLPTCSGRREGRGVAEGKVRAELAAPWEGRAGKGIPGPLNTLCVTCLPVGGPVAEGKGRLSLAPLESGPRLLLN